MIVLDMLRDSLSSVTRWLRVPTPSEASAPEPEAESDEAESDEAESDEAESDEAEWAEKETESSADDPAFALDEAPTEPIDGSYVVTAGMAERTPRTADDHYDAVGPESLASEWLARATEAPAGEDPDLDDLATEGVLENEVARALMSESALEAAEPDDALPTQPSPTEP